jgi:hypothetical protein
MRVSSRLFRVSVLLASTSLSFATVLTVPLLSARAQPAAPPADAASTAPADAATQGDPPAIAGRVSVVSGTVSFHAAGDTTWAAASLNYPVTNGDGFWTEPSAHAELQVGDDRIVLAGSTEFEIGALDVSQIEATQAQGATFLQIQSLPNGQTVTINTPRGAAQISAPGRYEIVSGDTNDATTITVVEGAVHVQGTGLALDVGPNQTATITGSDTFVGNVGPMQEDEFLRTELQQAQQVQQQVSQVPQEVAYMTGGTELAQYGSFEDAPQYGRVWYPRSVPSGWAPYREGHWAYVAPWGWNWVDNEPWGFAPFHYGRWVQYGGRWGWCASAPGIAYGGGYPVYSPALVSFVGFGAGVSLGVHFGIGGVGVGWFPLGFNEPYYPPYHVTNRYFENINRFSVTNIRNYNVTNIRNVDITHFSNARFATVMPEQAMVRGERVGQFGRPLPEADLAKAHPVFGRPPVAPSAETPNLSRAAAREYHLPVREAVDRRAAPGPAIRAEAEHGRPPLLRNAAPPPNVHAVPARAGARPGAVGSLNGVGRPGAGGLPALRQPGEGRPATAPVGRGERPEAGRPEATRADEAARPSVARPGEAARGEPARTEAPSARSETRGPGGMPELRQPGATPPGAGRSETAGERSPAGRESGRAETGTSSATRAPERSSTARPEAHTSETRAPEARAPEARTPEARASDVRAPEARAPEARAPEHRPATRTEAPARAEARREPAHAEAAPRPEPRHEEAPRPEPRHEEAPRPAPRHEEAPRPAPHAEAPRPAAHAEEHHPAPRPADHPEHKDEHH